MKGKRILTRREKEKREGIPGGRTSRDKCMEGRGGQGETDGWELRLE